MAHNGSIIQINLSHGGSHCFINHLKSAGRWSLMDNTGAPDPDTLDVNGYPISISNDGVKTFFDIPDADTVSGNWKCRWVGDGTISTAAMSGGEVIAGSKSGENGWFTCRPTTTSGQLGISAINAANPITHLEFYPEAWESLLDAGEIFSPRFVEVIGYAGVIRFLNPMRINDNPISKWEHMKPVDYFAWAGDELRGSIYRGITTKVGNDFEIDLGDSGSPQERDTHLIRFDADGDEDSTINGDPILFLDGIGAPLQYSTTYPEADQIAFITRDEGAGGWIKYLGDSTGALSAGIPSGWPPAIMLALCKKVGAHPWLLVPYLAADADTPSGTTDFATEQAAFVKQWCIDNNCEWMIPFFEPPNEVWNTFPGFRQTGYAGTSALRRWGVANAWHDWYGRAGSLMAAQINAVYGGDTSKYNLICGVQTLSGSPSSSDARLAGRHVSVDGGTPYRSWGPHVAPANYYNPAIQGQPAETDMAADYAAADTEGKALIAAEYAATVLGPGGSSIPEVADVLSGWVEWADGLPVTCYEGHYSPDYTGTAEVNALRAASKLVPAMRDYERLMFSQCLQRGIRFPSVYRISGNDAWAVFDPNIYVDDPPQWEAVKDVAFNPVPVRLTLRTSVE